MIKKTLTIINKLGLHARAAAKFVATASRHACHIDVVKQGRKVNGKSIMGMMMLAASQGMEIEIIADGEDEQQAMQDLEILIQNKFGEDE